MFADIRASPHRLAHMDPGLIHGLGNQMGGGVSGWHGFVSFPSNQGIGQVVKISQVNIRT